MQNLDQVVSNLKAGCDYRLENGRLVDVTPPFVIWMGKHTIMKLYGNGELVSMCGVKPHVRNEQ
jgi:hypothetical protein